MEKFYVKKVIFIIIAFAIVALGIDALIQGNGQSVRYVEENLVMVEDNQYHEENDGKIVAIKGKLTTNENVEDNLFGVSVANSPIMERIVLEYRYYNKAAQNYDENRLYGRWEDKTTVAEYIDNDLYQVEQFVDELTEDKSVQDINKQVFQTNAFLNGTFEIPSDKLLQFTVNKPVILDTTKSSVNVANYNKAFTLKDNEYTTVTNDLESVGDLRVRFRYLDLDKLGVVTIVAKQENGQLVEYVADNQDIVYEIFRGDLTKEQIIERMNENNQLGYMGVAITFAVLLIIGLFVFRDNIGDFLDKHPQFKVDVSDNIIQVFVIVVFAGLFILITSLSLNSIFKSVRAKNAVPVTATVTAFRDACRDDAEAYYYTYEYNVNDIVYEKSYDNVTSLPFSLSNPTPDGDVAEFEAYYNPEKPSESFIAQERAFPYVVVGCLIFFDAIFILGIAKATSNIIAETKKKN